MTDFDPNKPHDLYGLRLPTPNYWLGGQGLQIGAAYSAGGEISGTVKRIQIMPAGYTLVTIAQTQGPANQVGNDAYVVILGNGTLAEVKREAPPEVVVGPTKEQEKARQAVAKGVSA